MSLGNKIQVSEIMIYFSNMGDKNTSRPFVEEMRAQLLSYQIEKIKRKERDTATNPELFRQEKQAKDALIELDNDTENSMITDEDFYIGRWSHYRVPEKIEERLSLNRRTRAAPPDARLFRLSERQRNSLNHNCLSERTIPKLKVVLHQLEQPLELPTTAAKKAAEIGRKMKNHIGREALVISNKQEIRSYAKSERKLSSTIDAAVKGSENNRPQSTHDSIKAQNCGSSYQKIKRPFGFHNHQENDLVYEKEILSQLIKGKCTKPTPETTPLTTMIEYFTSSEKKKKVPHKLGLDRLLS